MRALRRSSCSKLHKIHNVLRKYGAAPHRSDYMASNGYLISAISWCPANNGVDISDSSRSGVFLPVGHYAPHIAEKLYQFINNLFTKINGTRSPLIAIICICCGRFRPMGRTLYRFNLYYSTQTASHICCFVFRVVGRHQRTCLCLFPACRCPLKHFWSLFLLSCSRFSHRLVLAG